MCPQQIQVDDLTEALFDFDNTYARLPDGFAVRLAPTPVGTPHLIKLNEGLAEQLGLDVDALRSEEGVAVLAGNAIAAGSEPLAMAYAGHQFGHWSPQLGDGRAHLLGEVLDREGIRRDIQLKGSGPTPFSRMGDGRAWLGPVLREYVVSEAMHALGIPTTRSLAAVTTGEEIYREAALPGAILTRVSHAHIRVGTFQYFAARQNKDAIKTLADFAIARLYPDAQSTRNANNPYAAFLEGVVTAQAELVAKWMLVGFIHGVMNTDNMSIAGETIDYGPCAFMDEFHPDRVFSSIDEGARYAYSNQPRIAQWNLVCFAQCLLPLLSDDDDKAVEKAQEIIDRFPVVYKSAYDEGMRKKLGLKESDGDIADDLLKIMAEQKADFTLTFRGLSIGDGSLATEQMNNPKSLNGWLEHWRNKTLLEKERQSVMQLANPAFIPRNHRVEEAIKAALDSDFSPFESLNRALEMPFKDQPGFAHLSEAPEPEEIVHQTFCGT